MIITAYFSHNIRGPKGDDATAEDQMLNCDIASQVAKMLKNAMPALDLYVPADQDEVVMRLFDAKAIDVAAILDADKRILAKRDILIGFEHRGSCSGGMQVEYDEAKRLGIEVFTFTFVDQIPYLVVRIIEWYYDKQRGIIDGR